MLVSFFQKKKQEEQNMVDMGFDEDGEEDDLVVPEMEPEEALTEEEID